MSGSIEEFKPSSSLDESLELETALLDFLLQNYEHIEKLEINIGGGHRITGFKSRK